VKLALVETLCLLLSLALIAPAQDPKKAPVPIKVAVSITDSTNQFGSAFSSAFRQLGDIEVVSVSEGPDYVLSGVVMCQPACSNVASYAVSLRLYSPMSRNVVSMLAYTAQLKSRQDLPALRDTLETFYWTVLKSYEFTLQTWVATFGRQRYEQSVREMVRDIDAACFERSRFLRRAIAALDSNAINEWATRRSNATWSC
jgi:hypothetical protein